MRILYALLHFFMQTGALWLAAAAAAMAMLAVRGLRRAQPPRPWLGILPLPVFALLDWLMLAALPWLGLSFGPVAPVWIALNVVRFLLFFLTLSIWRFAWRRGGPARRPGWVFVALWAANLTLAAVAAYSLYIEPFALGVTRLTLPAPALGLDAPLHILQISDLHVERITRRERAVLAQVAALRPDMIVLTGDYLNLSYLDDPQAVRDVRALLAEFDAPYGVYAVSGTVDHRMDLLFDGLEHITVLDDAARPIPFPGGELMLLGVSHLGWTRDAATLAALAAQYPDAAYTLLLYHTPDLAEAAAAAGVDLYLAGHTHGGQLRAPFYGAIVTFSRYGKRFEMGRYTLGDTTLYVARGIGMEGWGAPRARFLCPPELVLVTLE